jgi:hypothetical protein
VMPRSRFSLRIRIMPCGRCWVGVSVRIRFNVSVSPSASLGLGFVS